MSYTERNADPRARALTGGVVAVLQVGLALALVNGFAVTFFPREPDKPMPSSTFRTEPIKPDPVPPPPEDTVTEQPRTHIDTVAEPLIPPRPDDTVIAPRDPVLPTGGTEIGESTVIPPVVPSDPPARFTPKGAVPRGDMARWVTTDDYPTADIRAGHTGTVRFRVAIDAAGRVADCTVTGSSGYPGLDAATCRNVTRRARFEPARDAAGDTVSGSYEGTIRWVIPRD